MSEKEAALGVVRRVIDAVNSGQNTAGLTCMTEDVVIIDDIAPFHRAGREEAESWLRRLASARNRLHASLSFDEADVRVAGERAYVVAPAILKGNLAETAFDVSGTITSTLVRGGGTWLVNGLVWSSGR